MEEIEDEERESLGFEEKVEKVEEDILGAIELDEFMMDGILTGRH